VISGFRRGTNEICAYLVSHATCVGNSVPMFRDGIISPGRVRTEKSVHFN